MSVWPGSHSRPESATRASRGPIAAYRRYWLPELAALGAAAIAATLLFSLTDLDVSQARRFYRPDSGDPWPIGTRPVWLFFYRSAPWVTASLAGAGAALLAAGLLRPTRRRLRLHGVFILLCVAVGPGLIVNGVLKDHWGRPRPRQITELGGRFEHVPPLIPARTPGKSFPCGHCSVGFLYGAGWWMWRRTRPAAAAASLAAGTVVGTLLGIGRMAAGGHFLSDIVWSGLISLGTAHALYYYVLRIPAREDSAEPVYPRIVRSPRLKAAAIAGGALLAAAIAAGGLLATPHDADLAARIPLDGFPQVPKSVVMEVEAADVEIHLAAPPPAEITSSGIVHGFGFPTAAVRAEWRYEPLPEPSLRFRLNETGWFTDIDGIARVRIPCPPVRRITVRTDRGDIAVFDDRRPDPAQPAVPALDLHTVDGRIHLQPTPAPLRP